MQSLNHRNYPWVNPCGERDQLVGHFRCKDSFFLTSAKKNLYHLSGDYIDRGKFMSFFFDVPMEDIEEILDEHFEGDLGGGIFISDQKQSSLTYRPSYFQHLQHLVLRKSRERNKLSNCGCRDVDECAAGTSTCPSHSDCTNIAGGYRCSCSSGFAEIIS